jgi:apolipoprotein N-acyltransferase
VLADGTRLGISICYEMILPDFIRKVAGNGVHALVNLTNDSWFGPTAEPYFHGSLSVFRAIEHRVPVVRSTNTGTSFFVDALGRLSRLTPVYDEDVLVQDIALGDPDRITVYARWGDWFVGVCVFLIAILVLALKKDVESTRGVS